MLVMVGLLEPATAKVRISAFPLVGVLAKVPVIVEPLEYVNRSLP